MAGYHLLDYMPKGYLSSQTSIYFLNYHFVWCPAVNILRRGTVGHTGNTLAESIQAGQTLKQEALTL